MRRFIHERKCVMSDSSRRQYSESAAALFSFSPQNKSCDVWEILTPLYGMRKPCAAELVSELESSFKRMDVAFVIVKGYR